MLSTPWLAAYDLLNNLAAQVANKLLANNALNYDLVCSLFPSEPILDGIQWEVHRANIALKRDWIEIAADCHLIVNKLPITHDELKNTICSDLFSSDWLRLWIKERGLRFLSDNAVELLATEELSRLSSKQEQTIDKSNAYLELAQLAFQYQLPKLFEHCLRKSWDFVLGYGYRKDIGIFSVLDAIEHLSKVDPNSALILLKRISPIAFNISEFTDGDETRHSIHSVASILAVLNPQAAASKYEQELRDGEWCYADQTIAELIKNCDLSSPMLKRLYLTGLSCECYQKITKGVEDNNLHAIEIEADIKNLLGVQHVNTNDESHSETDYYHEKITIQPLSYPPEKFDKLVSALKGNYSSSNFWKSWYNYWVEGTVAKNYSELQKGYFLVLSA
ncbi:hypothetical protein PsalN5692_03855 (plasmid) [Piscirickettsia salmonis]|uniref:hypothetical protein n=1 Tax=Piscirickettsia salmonis TaxID=1238 RepID=UPI0012B742A3|nr:hypothetical protein [Piscirickettsia salmonis]QGP52346.1 hypothetical protein PsalN5692_03855 [Piscirickettsia salmonis]